MAGSESFGVESGFGEQVLDWMNNQAKKNKLKFEARAYSYEITTKNFGTFEMFSWIGDVKAARSLITKASKRFKIRVIEGGYRTKEKLLKTKKTDFAMVRKGERVIGHLEFSSSLFGDTRWKLETEERK
ncbi:MAG: hypothetical protein COB91_05100 [Nitrosopumilales archaeon]|jgi:hypothetical protein|uniref:Uncharacterized protein n=2 Tax=Nitrososphaerota TaxID=651137 RepID=A0A7K4NKD2_9ARCH|nr:hypothetical protein ALOHA_HF4000ANIW93E5ctg7g5 [uncultured marine crenarchaeote HF4000_ANIW93E5]NWK01689.1 hypothetical protein [Marine Group I thaumarchaeote]PBO83193.1 MAG: hypothetical protein COB91_05100 [Nitrosopumilales archaeon]|tara:strand:+ start:901 stop:1287 length:387 start_codon:yes stop_codon:yes gene_type:complete